MKQIYKFIIILLFIILISCPDETAEGNSSDNKEPAVISVTPVTNSTDVITYEDFVIQFDGSLDIGVNGELELSSPNRVFDIVKSDIEFSSTDHSNDTVTFTNYHTKADGFLNTATTYTGIIIRGFKGDNGKSIQIYNDSTYNFTTITCFAAGTKISTADGMVNIEDLNIDDEVYGYNFAAKSTGLGKITRIIRSKTEQYYEISIQNEILKVTGEHPFFVKNKGWINVKDLKLDDILIDKNGNDLQIYKIKKINETILVYNITVDLIHNYYVTDLEILVHNK